MKETPPILFVIYKRPQLQQQVMSAIAEARPPRLYVAADGPRDAGQKAAVAEARQLIEQFRPGCEVVTHFSEENLGCARRMKSAIDWFFEHESAGIILEDDCLPHPDFFPFCNDLLQRYARDARVASISGNNFVEAQIPALRTAYGFTSIFHCWGWATWRRAWRHFDWNCTIASETLRRLNLNRLLGSPNAETCWIAKWREVEEGKLDSWAIRFLKVCFERRWFCIAPVKNMVRNIGTGGEDATNCREPDPVAESAGFHGIQNHFRHPLLMLRWKAFDHATQARVFERRLDEPGKITGQPPL